LRDKVLTSYSNELKFQIFFSVLYIRLHLIGSNSEVILFKITPQTINSLKDLTSCRYLKRCDNENESHIDRIDMEVKARTNAQNSVSGSTLRNCDTPTVGKSSLLYFFSETYIRANEFKCAHSHVKLYTKTNNQLLNLKCIGNGFSSSMDFNVTYLYSL
jgi:hypothetical protein